MDGDGDICEELESYDFEDGLSRAPLHVAQPNVHCVTSERLHELQLSFPNLRRDKWTLTERKTLRANWRRINTHWPQFADPKFAFGAGHNNEGQWTSAEVEEKRREYREFDVLSRMANGLEDRLLCDVHIRCRKRFYDKSFHFTEREELPKTLERLIKQELKLKESIKLISAKYNVAPSVVDTIKRRPKGKTRFFWTDDSMRDLQLSVECVHDTKALPAREIKWRRVAKEMRRLGYEVDKSQCYNKWIRLNPNSVLKKYTNKSSSRKAIEPNKKSS